MSTQGNSDRQFYLVDGERRYLTAERVFQMMRHEGRKVVGPIPPKSPQQS